MLRNKFWTSAICVALLAATVMPALAAWEYVFHRSGRPTDRLEFKIEATVEILTGFRKRDDLPRGYQRYLGASGKREDGIICEVPTVLNHRSVNFAGVKPEGDSWVVVIGLTPGGSRDLARVTAKHTGRRMAVVVNHKLAAILRVDGVNDTGTITVDGKFPREVAEALVRRLYAEEE